MLSGPIGSGKTTVAKALVKLLPGPLVYSFSSEKERLAF
jgi:deoxyadenosine/deoxycytidine kinase